MTDVVTKLARALKAAGVAVVGVSPLPGGGYKVFPENLQAAADPIIAAFNPNDPAHDSAELNLAVAGHLDQERIYSALVWAIIDTYSPPATVAKYNTAKTKIVNGFKAQPWKA